MIDHVFIAEVLPGFIRGLGQSGKQVTILAGSFGWHALRKIANQTFAPSQALGVGQIRQVQSNNGDAGLNHVHKVLLEFIGHRALRLTHEHLRGHIQGQVFDQV